jgi:hypothetical protein
MKIRSLEDCVNAALELYTLEEILEHNDVSVTELLLLLVENGTVSLPEIEPL